MTLFILKMTLFTQNDVINIIRMIEILGIFFLVSARNIMNNFYDFVFYRFIAQFTKNYRKKIIS